MATKTKPTKAKIKAKMAPVRKPLDMDEFELAITKDWLKELTDGAAMIRSLPKEFVGEVRQDLVRLSAWAQHQHSRILFVLTQDEYTAPIEQLQNYCNTFKEFKNVKMFFINELNFEDRILEALDVEAPKVIIGLPFGFFAGISAPKSPQIVVPTNDSSWKNYTFLTEILPPSISWHILAYAKNGDSSIIQLPLLQITFALISDRIFDNEGH